MNSHPATAYQAPLYFVRSSVTPNRFYTVTTDERGLYQCECPDHRNRNRDCKHIRQVQAGTVRPARRKAAAATPAPAPFKLTVPDLWGDGGASVDRAVARPRVAS